MAELNLSICAAKVLARSPMLVTSKLYLPIIIYFLYNVTFSSNLHFSNLLQLVLSSVIIISSALSVAKESSLYVVIIADMEPATHSGYDYSKEDIGYDSTNEDDTETRDAKRARRDLADKPRYDKKGKAKVDMTRLM